MRPKNRQRPAQFFYLSLLALVLISLSVLSCTSKREILLSDDELYELASRKICRIDEVSLRASLFRSRTFNEAQELLNELLDRYPESKLANATQMALAELYFDDEEYEEAEAEYTIYLRFYPSAPDVEKAQYRLLLTHQRRIGSYDRDMTHTNKTLDLCSAYRNLYAQGKFIDDVELIEQDATSLLADHEFYVGRYYYRRGKYAASRARLTSAVEDYPESEAACKALYYLAKIDLKGERRADAIEKLQRLVKDYPNCGLAEKANKRLSKLKPS
ncbi:outer membrane protein assembly factor BamD [bacterium]|nr:outer membrane protein assembly factor BamD [bacterium]